MKSRKVVTVVVNRSSRELMDHTMTHLEQVYQKSHMSEIGPRGNDYDLRVVTRPYESLPILILRRIGQCPEIFKSRLIGNESPNVSLGDHTSHHQIHMKTWKQKPKDTQ